MSPFRLDVVTTGFLLAIPVLALGLRGDFTISDVVVRLGWCLLAGWVAVAVLHSASRPPAPSARRRQPHPVAPDPVPAEPEQPAAT